MAIIDPYVTNTGSGAGLTAALSDSPPPAKGGTEGPGTVLQLYVPAENTILDFGAGTTPGIRMITNTHAHLTAEEPLTTLSLGAAGGSLPAGGVPGFNLFSNANKKETILADTHESYSGLKEETVGGVWTETSGNAKTETIAGTMTQNLKSEHNLTVGKPADYKYNSHKTEGIGTEGGGNYILTVNGNKSETVQNNLMLHVVGKTSFTYDGPVSTIRKAQTEELQIDNHHTRATGFKSETFIGPQVATNLVFAATFNENLSFTQSVIASSAAAVNLSYNDANFSKNRYSTNTSYILILK